MGDSEEVWWPTRTHTAALAGSKVFENFVLPNTIFKPSLRGDTAAVSCAEVILSFLFREILAIGIKS